MSTKVKIPEQIFVTARYETQSDWDAINQTWIQKPKQTKFGFLHPHEPWLKPDEKRKKTQLDWAYRSWELLGNEYWISGYDWQTRTSTRKIVEKDLQPAVIDNVPTTGFMIIDTVNRYRGNKLLKVHDPRGYDFEITVACLFEIITHGEIKHGEIMNACVWKANKNLVIA